MPSGFQMLCLPGSPRNRALDYEDRSNLKSLADDQRTGTIGEWSEGSRLSRWDAGRGRPGLHQQNSAFLRRHIFLWIDRANIIGARTDQPVIVELFDDVSGPSSNPRDREDGREEVHVDAKRVVGGSRIEVHIGVEFLVRLYGAFDLLRHFEPLWIAAGMAQVTGHLP